MSTGLTWIILLDSTSQPNFQITTQFSDWDDAVEQAKYICFMNGAIWGKNDTYCSVSNTTRNETIIYRSVTTSPYYEVYLETVYPLS